MQEPLNSRLVQSRLEQMLSTLRNHDFRITPQRLAILRVLAASEGHPTVESIYAKVKTEFPTTSLATIYKTVSLLKEINEVLELGFADGSNRYDGNRPFPHPHVICTKCKRIVDSEVRDLQEMIRQVARETGFQILTHRLDFFGLCRNCLNR